MLRICGIAFMTEKEFVQLRLWCPRLLKREGVVITKRRDRKNVWYTVNIHPKRRREWREIFGMNEDVKNPTALALNTTLGWAIQSKEKVAKSCRPTLREDTLPENQIWRRCT